MQTLQIVVLEHLLEAEHAVGLRAAPLGGVDHPLLEGGEDVTSAHGHRRDADVLVGLTRDPGGRAEAVLAEVLHAVDGLLEPPQRLGADRLQHQALDVHAHLFPELVVELLAAAVQEPGHEGDVVDADAGTGHRRAEQHRGRVVAGPVMGPGEAALDQALVDRVEGLLDADHGAGGQHLDLHLVVGERADVGAEIVEHRHLIRLRRNYRLHADLDLGRHGRLAAQQRQSDDGARYGQQCFTHYYLLGGWCGATMVVVPRLNPSLHGERCRPPVSA